MFRNVTDCNEQKTHMLRKIIQNKRRLFRGRENKIKLSIERHIGGAHFQFRLGKKTR